MYILEAHFVEENLDGWPIGHHYRIPQHKTIQERIQRAQQFVDEFNWPIPTFVDSMRNDFNTFYAAWPDRAYLIDANKQLLYFGRLNEDGSRTRVFTDEISEIVDEIL